ncbi:MAG: elongation factor P [Patescibacteria group bacterium]|nr:elongation factor P [Patescibacteria group bacterium]
MLSYNEVRKGHVIVYEGSAYEILTADFLRMQQRKPVMKVKMRELATGKVKETSFQPSDEFEEAELDRVPTVFLYKNKGECWFCEKGNPKNRFMIPEGDLGMSAQFLKSNGEVTTVKFGEKIITVQLPIKMDLKVVEAPPSIKGSTASGGTKQVTLETGAVINTPMFVNEGDMVRVNTETGEYAERA